MAELPFYLKQNINKNLLLMFALFICRSSND